MTRIYRPNKRQTDEIDVIVANNIKAQRILKGVTQAQLSSIVGVSTQQITKYEDAQDRISSSRLYKIANFFNISINDLFKHDQEVSNYIEENFSSPDPLSEMEYITLIRKFSKIKNPKARKKAIELIDVLSEEN